MIGMEDALLSRILFQVQVLNASNLLVRPPELSFMLSMLRMSLVLEVPLVYQLPMVLCYALQITMLSVGDNHAKIGVMDKECA